MENKKIKYLYDHTSQETAYMVDDYPWGFKLRTKIRYWVESKDAKNGGQRFASQTINPKTGLWCKPKYSIYHPIVIMFLNENEHVKFICLNFYTEEFLIEQFKETHLNYLSDFQKNQLKMIIGYNKAMKSVKFEIVAKEPINIFSNDPAEIAKKEKLLREIEEEKKEQEESKNKINKWIGYQISKVVL